ncbi:site-specific DNA-methyltransferase [Paenibacillus silvae]|uniref:site-specific DNA-methyltransferase n=1 Tax=Paenibacillus silvae TaxID=1325358 RepID=UPI00200522F9|nr:DNA methyltransferase [Paenibacillus silvae]MCK6077563.1 site-specific DNA-methyltransferase [Paenibacillus silvae]MCK6151704.1 site-specific DNA-methyltransferase [Paenibacillus silvae]MCK6270191.1 site-specific DNA-methyltransferase [Paenibacillus silvae]
MSDKLQRFTELMQGIFELDKSDLDFGIYRIMNIRKTEIEKFLNVDLVKKVQDTLAPFASNRYEIEARLKEIEKACDSVGIDVLASKMADEYASLKSQLIAGVDLTALESDVYSALYSFFKRYYEEGDFISKRRYKEGVYAIPYEGEEVKLYWANHDQYYIKTTENFKDYTFKDGELKVHFRLVDATIEQNNNKEREDSKRVFMLYEESEERPDLKTIEQNGNELIIRFVFDVPADKKKKHAEENTAKIVEAITKGHKEFFSIIMPRFMDSKTKRQTKSLLDKHLEAYVAKNTFDYFIHKDLRGFLSRELDFYIKSEIIHLDDLDTTNEKRVETYLAKVKAIKRVGKIIIDFLAQIEEFQKKMWLKKKFIIETNWCITLDRIDESFYQEIIQNKDQVQEWVDMYAIDEIQGDLNSIRYSDPLTVDFLRQNQNLIVDTKHFSVDFKDRLISHIENIDELTDGLLIHSENFQAISFLQSKYQKAIKSIYIDPPYNADASAILYKNGFKHSSWISLMESRLRLASLLMKDNGMICLTIDDYEKDFVSILLAEIFGTDNIQGIAPIRNNPQGRSTVKGFAVNHEYAIFSGVSEKLKSVGRLEHSQKQKGRYSETDEAGNAFLWENFRKTGTDSNRSDRPKQYYPIFVSPSQKSYRIPELTWNSSSNSWDYSEQAMGDELMIYPITSTGEEKVWKWGIDRIKQYPNHIKVEINKDGIQLYRRNYRNDEGSLPGTWWDKAIYAAGSHGTNLLTNIFGKNRKFPFPKSIFAVMDCLRVCNADEQEIIFDFFAGSGTTGHAVVNLNRDDDGKRKYILVEMGEYFKTVTKARMLKVIYSNYWDNGKPVSRNTGISHIMKYIRLESYEDALSNIELADNGPHMQALFGEEYLLNYMLDIETESSLLKLDSFKTPFDYKLKVTEKNETIEKVIDIVETFNYLLGLSVSRQSAIAYFNAILDEQGAYEGAVSLVKDTSGIYSFKQVEGSLPDGRRALIIWRNITENLLESNAALDAYFTKHRINPNDREFDVIYVNGDNNLENMRMDDDNWKVRMTEIDFKKRMFEGV